MQAVGVLVSSVALTGLLAGQPTLRITSPVDGTTVHPGESVYVTVEVPHPESVQFVMVVGTLANGNSKEALSAPPYRFRVDIPKDIRPDKYELTALGASPGGPVYSNPLTIVVERADSPVSLSVYPTVADFTMDQKRYFSVTGVYADKTTADLSQSSRIKYVSSAPEIATVDAQGIVSPVSQGAAKIRITYGDLNLEVPVRVRGSGR
jgi:Bacterial Ig-like domain (group 2)/Bacterial Ig domain